MKKNDITALHGKAISELQADLEIKNQELAVARLQKAAGKLADTASIHRLTHDIAVYKTIIREKEILAELQGKLKKAEVVEEKEEVVVEEKKTEKKKAEKKKAPAKKTKKETK